MKYYNFQLFITVYYRVHLLILLIIYVISLYFLKLLLAV